jgi:hypothetical protein
VIYQKTDQVGTDGGIGIYIEYLNEAGAVKIVDTTLDAIATDTEVAVCDDFYRLRDFYAYDPATGLYFDVADTVILGLTGAAEQYAVIPTSKHRAEFTRYMVPKDRRAFLVYLQTSFPDATKEVEHQITLTGKDPGAETVLQDYYLAKAFVPVIPIELQELTDVTFKILKTADANHDNMQIETCIVECW